MDGRPTWGAQSPDRVPVGPSARIPTGTVIGQRYRLLEIIGRGGMSVVYAAHDVMLDRRVAVKVLDRERGQTLPALRAGGEARLAARFAHPALVTVFDTGTVPHGAGAGCDFVVMELVPGGDLRDRLGAGALDWRQVLRLGVDLSEGLAHLHDAGFLHRDVKPANVLLWHRPGDGTIHAKLTDFGLSARGQAADDGYGTAAYVSPEQVRGHDLGPQSDVYGLGLVLLEALTGRVEFPGAVEQSAFARLRHDPYVPATVPSPFRAVLMAMTDPEPARRPGAAQAAAVLSDIQAIDRVRTRCSDPSVAAAREAARDAAIERLGILDWPPMRAFHAATNVARRLLSASSACVVIPSSKGLAVSSPTPEAHLPALLHNSGWLVDPSRFEPWTLDDLSRHPSSRDDARLIATGARSFAGCPLVGGDGASLGTLCVFDSRARGFAADQLDELAQLSALIVSELELRQAARRAALAR